MRRRWKLVGWVIALGVLAGLVGQGAYRRYEAKRRQTARAEPGAGTSGPIRVTCRPVARGTVRNVLLLTGTVKPMAEVRVMSKVSGRLEELRLEDGTLVDEGLVVPHKGVRIAIIDHEMFDAQVQQAEAAVAALKAEEAKIRAGARPEELTIAEANLRAAEAAIKRAGSGLAQARAAEEKAVRDLHRTEFLAQKNVVSAEALDAAQTAATIARQKREEVEEQIQAAKEQAASARGQLDLVRKGARDEDRAAVAAKVAQAEAALRLARVNLDESTVRAPIAGVVAERSVDEGKMVSPSGCIVRMVQMDRVKVVVGVGDRHVARVTPGKTKATVTLDAYEDARFEGTVGKVSPVADPTTMTVAVEIHVPNPGHRLKPGMFTRVRLVLEEHRGVPVVPDHAVVRAEGRAPYVFVVTDSRAHARSVALGLTEGSVIEVDDGLRPGDLVVTRGQHLLKDDVEVEAVAEEDTP